MAAAIASTFFTAEFHANHVIAGVGAKLRTMKQFRYPLCVSGIVRRHGHRGGQAAGDLGRETRPRQCCARCVTLQFFVHHLVKKATRTGLQTLTRPDKVEGRTDCIAGLFQHSAEPGAGNRYQHEIGPGECATQLGQRSYRVGKRDTGQVALIGSLPGHGRYVVCIAIPQSDREAVSRQQHRQRRTPGPGTQHGDNG